MLLSAYVLMPGSHFGAMWRHPYSETDFCDRVLYENLARSLDRYGYDYAFVPESLAVPMGDDGVWETMTSRGASGAVRHDPALLVSPMIGVTRRLRFTVTLSTTFMEPFHLARTLSTLNHFSHGRIAWNVVTSAGASNAINFAHLTSLDHRDLYERAEEVLTVCRELWTSWDEDALIADKRSGIYARAEKIRQINHKGRHFDVRGPLTLPYRAGPTLMAAGVSPRGRDFAARWAEVIFAIQSEPAAMRELRDDIRARAERMGRSPEDIRLMAAVQPVVGETREIAAARAAHLDTLVAPEAARSYLAAMLGLDLSSVSGDAPLQPILDTQNKRPAVDAGGTLAWLANLLDARPDVRVDEAAVALSGSTGTPRLVGTATDVTDQLQALFEDCCDGFVITPTHFPGTFEEFGRAVIPELRARGLVASHYQDH
ncbi:Nitrilotriacetate monooxygenase component A [Caballeronia glathei]|uniref:Dibenzothiophene desulfurization enzyme n=2 Tax=Caballeronia glathei TaxID=60547 RepID=A0A069PPZ7_9BURK|nr:NtaA/DmoA family FMN-dependent monooxygenase [Caballeronia glathei]KDR39386.1 dibenzothiophene desulfurization enzyme [Caballeronia glathei]CDY73250.1 Nitrilotriacetate monooxygenase component A [Caballeronia glathei]